MGSRDGAVQPRTNALPIQRRGGIPQQVDGIHQSDQAPNDLETLRPVRGDVDELQLITQTHHGATMQCRGAELRGHVRAAEHWIQTEWTGRWKQAPVHLDPDPALRMEEGHAMVVGVEKRRGELRSRPLAAFDRCAYETDGKVRAIAMRRTRRAGMETP